MREREIAEQLMIEIRKFVPFKADCYTLLCDFYQRCYNIQIPRYEYNSVKQEKPPDKVWEDWEVIEEFGIRPGDVIIFLGELGVHVGIILDSGDFLHSTCISKPPIRIGKISDVPKDPDQKEYPIFVRYRR